VGSFFHADPQARKQVHGLEPGRFGLGRGERLEDGGVAGAAGPFGKGQVN
jgi:hypothetical protein